MIQVMCKAAILAIGTTISICIAFFSAAVGQTNELYKLEGVVVAENDMPKPSVVIEIYSEAMDHAPLVARIDPNGHFLIAKERSDAPKFFGRGIVAAVFSPGYKSIMLGSGAVGDRPVKLRLQPDEPIPIRIVDEANSPVSGAKIVNGTGLSYFCRFDTLAECLSAVDFESFVSVTDAAGNALLRGTTRNEIRNVAVIGPDGRWTQFLVPQRLTRSELLEFRLPSSRQQLSIHVIDSAGKSVPDAVVWLRTPGDAINEQTLKQTVPMDFRCGLSDQNGRISFSDLSISEAEVWVFFASDDGRSHIQRGIVLDSGEINHLKVSLPPYQEVSWMVLDGDQRLPVPDVQFILSNGVVNFNATSNEDGIVAVRLSPGTWSCTLNSFQLADGYSCVTAEDREIKIAMEKVDTIPPFVLKKGRVLEAEIRGVDLQEQLSNYVHLVTQNPREWRSGRILSGNKIRFTVHEDFSLDDIADIYTTDNTGLKVISKEPLVLEAERK